MTEKINLNFGGVKPLVGPPEFEFIPMEGERLLTITKIQYVKPGSKDGTFNIGILFKDEAETQGSAFYNLYVDPSSDTSKGYALAFLNAVYDTDLSDNDDVSLDPDDLLGRKVVGTVVLKDHYKKEMNADGSMKKQNEIVAFAPTF